MNKDEARQVLMKELIDLNISMDKHPDLYDYDGFKNYKEALEIACNELKEEK